MELFLKDGFENVHIQDITDMAGTSKGTFYTYFTSKDEVIVEHYNKIDDFYNKTFYALNPEEKSMKKLKKIFCSGFEYVQELGYEFLSIVLINQLNSSKESTVMNDPNRPIQQITQSIIKEGQIRGEFNSHMSAKDYADILTGYFRGIFAEYCINKNPNITIKEFGESHLNLIVQRILSV